MTHMAEHPGLNRNEPSTAAPAREPTTGGYTNDGITPRVRVGGESGHGRRSRGTKKL
jgi:hypothetical protein